MHFIKDTPDVRNAGRLTGRQEKLDAVEPPLLDARKQRRMSFAHMRGPNHGIHAVFHVLNPLRRSFGLLALKGSPTPVEPASSFPFAPRLDWLGSDCACSPDKH